MEEKTDCDADLDGCSNSLSVAGEQEAGKAQAAVCGGDVEGGGGGAPGGRGLAHHIAVLRSVCLGVQAGPCTHALPLQRISPSF